ncbi:hypothetical protein [Clostridium beijerinckii]|uniref:hypothetical protein n=1 Tax=Clostridium beijerinckii TaxID=1520 RepID=UPI001360F641|nr:hypothetical protein [Clostridium beijerinckii]MZK50962.1 hypothetical protein [Clostridium beijerinckii]MZK59164.1 hypothetical protein [Clostridium beijerinckii]MZK69283.1 hypothetical protein [Clostridium beijerinckii]MZK74656.1 hypothetical protein [Clostridium beijerinckii]MZK84375.1 hypothetical protein [Clostridium beijerinckii]
MKLKYPKESTESSENKSKSDIINIQLFDNNEEYDGVIKIVGKLFNQCKDKLNNDTNIERDGDYTNNKKIINQFDNVMSCIRFEISEKKDIFKDNKDNLNLLMEISESIDLVDEFKKLLDLYLKVMNINIIQIEIDKEQVKITNSAEKKDNSNNSAEENPEVGKETTNSGILPEKIRGIFN